VSSKKDKKLFLSFLGKGVDILNGCDILFSVMRDRIELEEIFEADPQARAEFNAVCDQWQAEAIAEQEAELKAMAKQEEVSK
jgi:hypothetical protein